MSTLKMPLTAEDHTKGPANAAVTLLEYGDYECPYCAAAHVSVKGLQRYFGARMRFAFRHFPLSQVHPMAAPAAEAAEYAGAEGKFWEMHDAIYANQDRLDTALLLSLAETLGLSADDLRDVLAVGAFQDKVQRDFMGGVRSGVNGTPTFFINGERHEGSYELTDLARAIEERTGPRAAAM